MSYDAIRGLIGLSIRARTAALGAVSAEKTIRAGKAGILFISDAASESTKKEFMLLADRFSVKRYIIEDELLNGASGRDNLKVMVLMPGKLTLRLEEECIARYPS